MWNISLSDDGRLLRPKLPPRASLTTAVISSHSRLGKLENRDTRRIWPFLICIQMGCMPCCGTKCNAIFNGSIFSSLRRDGRRYLTQEKSSRVPNVTSCSTLAASWSAEFLLLLDMCDESQKRTLWLCELHAGMCEGAGVYSSPIYLHYTLGWRLYLQL